jgi:cysteine-rich repeat protein
MKLLAALVSIAIVCGGCTLRPPFLLVTVEDPDSLATGFERLFVGMTPDRMRAVNVDRQTFPLTVTVTAQKAGEQDVWVEARDQDGETLARGRTTAPFKADGTPTATVVLRNSCTQDRQCADISFCSGTKKCLNTICGCVESQCGDGFHDPMTEECDDGNTDDTDGCTGACRLATCGDGFVWVGVESCDDGNGVSGDGCRADCRKVEICGDGVADAGEQCDDGNINPNDGCYVADRLADPQACHVTSWRSSVVVGLGVSGGQATNLILRSPSGVALDRLGNLYVVAGARIRRIDALTGVVTAVAGTGTYGYSGDGGSATAAALDWPTGVFVDSTEDVFLADGARIRRVDADSGKIATIAGDGTWACAGDCGDGGPAVAASLGPVSVVADIGGDLYVADRTNSRIRRIDGRTGLIATVAGTGVPGFGGDNGPATVALLDSPWDVVVDRDGNLLIADWGNSRIRRVDRETGTIATIAGGGSTVGDGVAATSVSLYHPYGLSMDGQGNVFIADSFHNQIRRVDALSGIITTVAGTGVAGFTGDGSQAVSGNLSEPRDVVLDAGENIYVADTSNQRIRRVDATTGVITTVVGGGLGCTGDGRSATKAQLSDPVQIVIDSQGDFFVLERGSASIRKVNHENRIITTVAGDGVAAFEGDGGPASQARFSGPADLAIDTEDNLYILDNGNNRIRYIDHATGVITTVVGDGTWGLLGDGGSALTAQISWAQGVFVDSHKNIYIGDTCNARIRKVDAATGIINTIAGSGTPDCTGVFAGDGGPATAAKLSFPTRVFVDANDNVLFSDTNNQRIRRVDAITHLIQTVAGDGTDGFAGDGALATAAFLSAPWGLCGDPAGNIYFVDSNSSRVRRVDAATGLIDTVVGTGLARHGGDFGAATAAELYWPLFVTTDPVHNLYIGEGDEHVRFVDGASGVITTIIGALTPEGDGPVATSVLGSPWSWTSVSAEVGALIADGSSGRVRRIDWQGMEVSTVAGYLGNVTDGQAPSDLAYQSRLLNNPFGIVFLGSTGTALVSERDGHTLRRITLTDPANPLTWTTATYAGQLPRAVCCNSDADPTCTASELADTSCADDSPGFAGDGSGSLADVRFDQPSGLAYDPADPVLGAVVYIADSGNQVIRRLELARSRMETIAGSPGERGFLGDGVSARTALLHDPETIALGPKGTAAERSLYVADTANDRVRRLDLDTGIITTVIGDGTPASSGIGRPAKFFPVDEPQGLLVDRYGNLYISSRNTIRLVYAGADGLATGDDYVTTIYGTAPRDVFPMSVTKCLSGLGTEPGHEDDSVLLVLDACQGFLIRLTRTTS